MKTKNLTPFLFGAKLTSRKPPQLEMTAIVRGAFRFVPGEPLLFTEMPLGYTHAFGGPGYAQNPSGKGVSSSELPNVEHAGELVRSRKDKIAPAGFGPYNPAWPQRSGKVGKDYGKAWLEK